MANTREIKRRIKGVTSTSQITRAMEMVATSKLKRAQDRVVAARPYVSKVREILGNLAANSEVSHPLLTEHAEVKRVAIFLITSNRGLCGSYNANLIREARTLHESLAADGREIDLYIVGRKGLQYFRFQGFRIAESFLELPDGPSFADVRPLAQMLMDSYAGSAVDEVYLIYSNFKNAAEQRPTVERILPVQGIVEEAAAEEESQRAGELDYLFEPDAQAVFASLLPHFVENSVYRAFLEATASEQGARRTAMKTATDNAEDMITNLTRLFNRARQAQITQELAEIVGTAQALE